MQPSFRPAKLGDAAPTVKSITSTLLDLPPSCVEFAPCRQEYLVVGTYYLEQNDEHEGRNRHAEQTRSGSLILFRLQGHNLYDFVNSPSELFHVLGQLPLTSLPNLTS